PFSTWNLPGGPEIGLEIKNSEGSRYLFQLSSRTPHLRLSRKCPWLKLNRAALVSHAAVSSRTRAWGLPGLLWLHYYIATAWPAQTQAILSRMASRISSRGPRRSFGCSWWAASVTWRASTPNRN